MDKKWCHSVMPSPKWVISSHPSPIATDNSTALGIVTSSIKQKRSKTMDMEFHWVQDRVRQNQFLVYWALGYTNLADYFSKHHPAHQHKKMRRQYLVNTATTNPNISYGSYFMQGCVPRENIHEDIRYKMYKITAHTISVINLLKSSFSSSLNFP